MKILRIADISDSRTGGMARAMYCSGDPLAAMGHQVDYLFAPQLGGNPRLRRFTVPRLIPKLVERMMAAGKSYDVVEIHEPMGMTYCRRRKSHPQLPPAILFSHGLEVRGRLSHLAYKNQKSQPVSFVERYEKLTVVWQANSALRHADQILCLNTEDRDYLQQHGIAPDHITLHFNGVDEKFLHAGQQANHQITEPIAILFLGSWCIRKGSLDLAPALTNLLRANANLRFTVAGCGVPEATVLQDFPADVHSKISVIQKITTDEDLIATYRQHNIFVLPSYFEGQPLVMLEAAAMGLALVTTNICGMRDFVEDGINGLKINVGDPASLQQALACLIANPAEAQHLGEAARIKAQNFTWKNSAMNLLRAYEAAIKIGAKAAR